MAIAKEKDERKHIPGIYESGLYCYICSRPFTTEDITEKWMGEYPIHSHCKEGWK